MLLLVDALQLYNKYRMQCYKINELEDKEAFILNQEKESEVWMQCSKQNIHGTEYLDLKQRHTN